MTLREFGGIANVEKVRARVSHPQHFIQLDDPQNLFEIAVEKSALAAIENGVVGEIRRSVRLVCRDQKNELLLRHRLQRVVHQPLRSQ